MNRFRSLGRQGLRETIQVDRFPVPASHTKYDRDIGHQTPSTVIVFFDVRRRGVNKGAP